MKNAYLIIGFISLLVIGVVIFGFSVAGSPFETRARKFDDERVRDIRNLKSSIQSYYSKNKSLPKTLSDLDDSSYSRSRNSKEDPETGKEYEYSVTNSNSYKICATFATASDKDKDSYSYYDEKFDHPKGNYCFELEITNYSKKSTPISTSNQKATKILDEKIKSVSADTGSVANLSNFPYGLFSNAKFDNGFVSSLNTKKATVTFKFKKPEKIASITNTFASNSADYCADNSCYSWSAKGKTSDNSVVSIVKTIKTDPGSMGSNIVSKESISADKKFKEVSVTVNLLEKTGRIYWKMIEFKYK